MRIGRLRWRQGSRRSLEVGWRFFLRRWGNGSVSVCPGGGYVRRVEPFGKEVGRSFGKAFIMGYEGF